MPDQRPPLPAEPAEGAYLAELRARGFTLTPCSADPGLIVHRFRRGTFAGRLAMLRDASAAYLVDGANEEPHNGAFAEAMDALERAARKFRTALYVMHVWDERLGQHLMRKRRYSPTKRNEFYHYVYRPTQPDN
jgi:hypothetical protein